MSDRFSTGLRGLQVGSEVYQEHVPDESEQKPPPDYSQEIPIGTRYSFPVAEGKYKREYWEEDGVANMQISSSDRILICDRTGGAKTSTLKRIVYGLWKGGSKIIHLTDVKNDFANIDDDDGVPAPFVEEAGLAPGEEPGPLPVEKFQPRLLYNEYYGGPPDELEGVTTYAYGFQDLGEGEIKTLVNANSTTQQDILTNAIAQLPKLTYAGLIEYVEEFDANFQAKRSLVNSVRRLKDQEVLEEEYREVLPMDRLGDGVVQVSMDNWTNFKKGDTVEDKLEVQIAIALRRIKQALKNGEIEGPVVPVFDEAHSFCSDDNDISTPHIVDLIDLGRAFDVPMIFSSQRASQLSREIIDGVSHFFIGPNVPPQQRMDLLRAADLVDHEDYTSGKWTKIFRNMKPHEFLQVDSERSLWRVVSPFAPPCFHPWEEDKG